MEMDTCSQNTYTANDTKRMWSLKSISCSLVLNEKYSRRSKIHILLPSNNRVVDYIMLYNVYIIYMCIAIWAQAILAQAQVFSSSY